MQSSWGKLDSSSVDFRVKMNIEVWSIPLMKFGKLVLFYFIPESFLITKWSFSVSSSAHEKKHLC